MASAPRSGALHDLIFDYEAAMPEATSFTLSIMLQALRAQTQNTSSGTPPTNRSMVPAVIRNAMPLMIENLQLMINDLTGIPEAPGA